MVNVNSFNGAVLVLNDDTVLLCRIQYNSHFQMTNLTWNLNIAVLILHFERGDRVILAKKGNEAI